MTIREQYTYAYRLLRESTWDYRTYHMTAESLGIDRTVYRNALKSYLESLWCDEIGDIYRSMVRDFNYGDYPHNYTLRSEYFRRLSIL